MNKIQKWLCMFFAAMLSINVYAQIIPKGVGGDVIAAPKGAGSRDLLSIGKEISPFSSGLALVSIFQNNNWEYAYIDKNGKEAALKNFISSGRFQEGLAKITILQNFGARRVFINTSGKQVSATYDDVQPFKEGRAAVSLEYKWGFIDKNGIEIIPVKYDNTLSFSEGLAAVYSQNDDAWGFIDKAGREVIPFRYHYAMDFSGGLALVSTAEKQEILKYDSDVKKGIYSESPLRWGYIDTNGIKKIQLTSRNAGPFSGGLAPVGKAFSNEWGYIDTTGKFVVPQIYSAASCFFEDMALVKRSGRWGYIDRTGKEIVPPKYEDALHFSEGLASVCLNNKCGYINKKGEEVIPLKFDGYVYPRIMMGDTPLRKTNKYTYSFSDGLAVVRLNGKWVIIDQTGKIKK